MTWNPLEEALFVDRAAADPDAPVTPFVALQRVVIRMLFDPQFTAAVYDDSQAALVGLELNDALVRQLVENDRRLWNADRMRRRRSLKVLLEEFKVSTTLVLNECREIGFLDSFFGSEFFHAAVQRRGYMATAFVAYLVDAFETKRLTSAQGRAALTLEGAMAQSRRALRDARRGRDPALQAGARRSSPKCSSALKPGEQGWIVAPGVGVCAVPKGTIELIQHVEHYLFEVSEVPALTLCDDAPRPDPLPPLDANESDTFLLEPQPGGKVDLSEISAAFACVVDVCAAPASAAQIDAALAAAGEGVRSGQDLTEALVEATVLRRVRAGEDGRLDVLPTSG